MKPNLNSPIAAFFVFLCLSSLPLAAEQFDLFTYEDHGETIAITGLSNDAAGDIEIPSEINGKPVTRIAGYAFSRKSQITSIVIPDSVKIIASGLGNCASLCKVVLGKRVEVLERVDFYDCPKLTIIEVDSSNPFFSSQNGILFDKWKTRLLRFPPGKAGNYVIPDGVTAINQAFTYCTGLTRVTVPNSVTTIDGAFMGCSNLTSVNIPDGVATIGRLTFSLCSTLGTVAIPKSITSIGRQAFYGCGLTDIIIPDSVTSIQGGAFSHCAKLTDITIPNSVTLVESAVFSGCISLTNITIPDSVTSIKGWDPPFEGAFSGCTALSQIAIPDSVTEIGSFTFEDCSSLTNVSIGHVTSIGAGAFYGCHSLGQISVPAGVTTIGDRAFSDCSNLTSISVDPANSQYASIDGVLFNKSKSTMVQYPGGKFGAYEIPHSVTYIKRFAFRGCRGLTGVTIPEWVTEIGANMFAGCDGLMSINIPSKVTTINPYAFSGCRNLKTLVLPNSLKEISRNSFADCRGLTSITIPKGVTSILPAFAGCSALTSINVEAGSSAYTSVDGVLFNRNRSTLLRCPEGKAGAYTVPASVTEIAGDLEGAFENCVRITSITIPKSVSKIGSRAFDGCRSLTTLETEAGNKNYQSIAGALFNAGGLITLIRCPEGKASFNIPATVTSISRNAFQGCRRLTSITIPKRVANIPYGGFGPFWGCHALKSIRVESGNQHHRSIDGVLFDAEGKTLIRCPEGKTGSYHVPDSVTEIVGRVESVQSGWWIEAGAFENCHRLEAVTIPENVSAIGYAAFAGCRSLRRATFLGNSPIHYGESGGWNNVVGVFDGAAPDFTIHYLSGRKGFTSPTWECYPTVKIDQAIYPAAPWLLKHAFPYDTDVNEDANLLLAYALDVAPDAPIEPSLPKTVFDRATGTLSLTFRAASPGITYTVETSTDLRNWTSNGVSMSGLETDNSITTSIAQSTSEDRFLRLVVDVE